MQEYTFRTMTSNGAITLPVEYSNKLVEITVREIDKPKARKRDLLSPITLNTADWKWSREDANER